MKKLTTILAAIFSHTTGCFAAPANDNFDEAILISGFPVCVLQSDIDSATSEGELEPILRSFGAAKSVWFTWVAEDAGVVSFSSQASGFETALGVFTGDMLGGLTRVGSGTELNEDEVIVSVTAGTTYHIGLTNSRGAVSGVSGVLTISPVAALLNDHFADAIPVGASVLPAKIAFNNLQATKELGEPDADNEFLQRSIWFTFEAPEAGTYKIDTYDSGFDPQLDVYSGTEISALALLESDDEDDCESRFCGSEVRVVAAAGDIFRIRVSSPVFESTTNSGDGVINVTKIQAVADNDNFADRINIGDGSALRYLAGFTDATSEPGEPAGPFGNAKSVWYQFTPVETGNYSFAGSAFFVIYEGDSIANLTPASYPLIGGQSYQVAAYQLFSGSEIEFVVSRSFTPALIEEALATELGTTDASEAFTMTRRVPEFYGPDSETSGGFWLWKPASTGVATLVMDGFISDPNFSIEIGDRSEGFIPLLASGRGHQRSLKFPVTAGQTYSILGTIDDDDEDTESRVIGFRLTVEPGDRGSLPPLAPTSVQLTLAGETAMLTWTPNPETAVGTAYQIQRSVGLTGFSNVGAPTTGNTATITSNDPTNFFRIVASLP